MSELRERIQTTIESEPVVAFVKGTHERAACGNSLRAMHALRSVGASFTAVDVLPDPAIRQELSALTNWPTIPQIFIGGELEAKLNEKLGESWREPGAEKTVPVVA